MDAMATVLQEVPCAAARFVNARRAVAAGAEEAIIACVWFSFFEIVPSREDWPTFKKCPGAFVYAKSAPKTHSNARRLKGHPWGHADVRSFGR